MTARLKSDVIIYPITDGTATAAGFLRDKENIIGLVSVAVAAGIPYFQIREKHLPDGLLLELTQRAAEAVSGTKTKLLLNGRIDIACKGGADGVHLPSDGVSVAEARDLCNREMIVAVSTHSPEEVLRAKADGADLVVFGPVFATPGKGEPKGIDGLRAARQIAGEMPVIALGGITGENVDAVIEAGAAGFAAIRYLNDKENLKKLGEWLKSDRRGVFRRQVRKPARKQGRNEFA